MYREQRFKKFEREDSRKERWGGGGLRRYMICYRVRLRKLSKFPGNRKIGRHRRRSKAWKAHCKKDWMRLKKVVVKQWPWMERAAQA